MGTNKKGLAMPLNLACDCDKGSLRPTLQHVYFIDGYAYASEGHILIKQSINYFDVENRELLNGKAFHYTTFKELCKCLSGIVTEEGIKATNKGYSGETFFPFVTNPPSPPNFQAVIPTSSTSIEDICLNPKLIDIVAKCLYSDDTSKLVFTFSGDMKAVTVTNGHENQLALIMPTAKP